MFPSKIQVITVFLVLSSVFALISLSKNAEQTLSGDRNITALTPYIIHGASMEPTLKDSESVRVDTNYYKTHNLSRGDIVAFKLKTQEKPFVKRVITLPGDELVFGEDGNIYVNSKKIDEPYILEKDYHFDASKLKILLIPLKQTNDTVPQGTALVLGDNRRNSFDSEDYGFVPIEYIFGKVI